MPKQERFKTDYPGVSFIMGTAVATGKPERIYFIRYRRDGKLVEEKAGRQFQDAMTPAKAARIRAERIEGKALSNQARREEEKAAKAAEAGRWTLAKLRSEYASHKPENHALSTDRSRFETYLKPAFGEKEPAEVLTLDLAACAPGCSSKASRRKPSSTSWPCSSGWCASASKKACATPRTRAGRR